MQNTIYIYIYIYRYYRFNACPCINAHQWLYRVIFQMCFGTMDLCPSATQYPDSCAPRDWDPQRWDPQGWGPQGWGPQGGDHHFGFKLASHLHKGVAIHVVQNGLERKASLQQSRCEISLLLYKANAFHILFGWAQVCSRWLQLAQVGTALCRHVMLQVFWAEQPGSACIRNVFVAHQCSGM